MAETATPTAQAAPASAAKPQAAQPAPKVVAGSSPVMAGFLERFVAMLVDGIILGIGMGVLMFVFGLVFGGAAAVSTKGGEPSGLLSAGMGIGTMLMYPVLFAIVFLYYGYFYSKKGQTPGKSLLKIKVVHATDHQYVSLLRGGFRDTIGKWISGMAFYLGYLWYFMSLKRQSWHDTIADTYVVKTDEAGNILMTGPSEYPKEPVKTFVPCGCLGLFVIGGWLMMGAMFATLLATVNPTAQLEKAKNAEQMQYQYQDMMQDVYPAEEEDAGAAQEDEMTQEEFNKMMDDLQKQLQEQQKAR